MSTETFFVVINPEDKDIGYSVWRNAELFKHGIIKSLKTDDNNVILEHFFNEINNLFNEYPPTLVVYKNMSKSTASKEYFLLQGMIMALCVQKKIYFKLVSITEWKKTLGCTAKKISNEILAEQYVKSHYAEKVKDSEAIAICIGASICTN